MFEVKSFCQVRHLFATPWRYFFAVYSCHPKCGEPFLDEEDLRVMICVFSEDITATGPRGNYGEWDAESWFVC